MRVGCSMWPPSAQVSRLRRREGARPGHSCHSGVCVGTARGDLSGLGRAVNLEQPRAEALLDLERELLREGRGCRDDEVDRRQRRAEASRARRCTGVVISTRGRGSAASAAAMSAG